MKFLSCLSLSGFIYLLVHFLCGESYTPIRVEYITQFQPIEDSVLLLTPRKAQDEIYVLAIPINSTLDPLKHVKNSSNHVSEFHALFEDYKVPRVDGFQHVYELPTSTTCNIYIITYNTEKYSKTSCAIRYPWGYRSPAEIMLIEYDYQVLALVFLFFVVELMNLINMPEKQGLHSFFIIFLIIVWAGLFISTRIRIEIDESLIAVFEYATKLRFIVILAAIFYTMTGPPFAPVEWEISNYIFICLLIFLGKSITADLVVLAPTVFAVIAFRMDRQRALSILRYRRINIIKQSNEINCDPDSLNKYYRHLRISLIVFLIVLIEFVFALSQHYWYHANLFCLLTVVFYVAYYFIIFRYNIADKEDKSTKDIGK